MYSSAAVQPIAVCESDGLPTQLILICYKYKETRKKLPAICTPRMGPTEFARLFLYIFLRFQDWLDLFCLISKHATNDQG